MPKLSKKAGSAKTKKRDKSRKQKTEELLEAAPILDESLDDESIEDSPLDSDTMAEVAPGVLEEPVEKVKLPEPFSDGIVSSCLDGLVTVVRVGGQEVLLLSSFLQYFATTGSYIGAIVTKWSFMKKKGGRLL